jgi:hypothetical protein
MAVKGTTKMKGGQIAGFGHAGGLALAGLAASGLKRTRPSCPPWPRGLTARLNRNLFSIWPQSLTARGGASGWSSKV